MTETRTYKLVVGVDFEEDGDLALDTALDQAARNPLVEIHALYVDKERAQQTALPPSTRTLTTLQELERRCEERVELARGRHPDVVFGRIVTHYRVGPPSSHIVRLAIDLDADCIVVGTHNRKGLRRLMLGSVSEDVVHIATCPVIVARRKDHERTNEESPIFPRRQTGRPMRT